ncbi:hypothetical protein MPSEU_000186700 [Mayamaea pseudoterrestris]|nr:hypothetical protein MPSEU_000186700 [Mayamaea pseudoterrestris]
MHLRLVELVLVRAILSTSFLTRSVSALQSARCCNVRLLRSPFPGTGVIKRGGFSKQNSLLKDMDLDVVECEQVAGLTAPDKTDATAESLASSQTKEPFLPINMPSQSILLLNLVAILWGSQHAVIKLCVQDSPDAAGPFTLLRFGIAALLASPFTPGLKSLISSLANKSDSSTFESSANDLQQIWRWGLELGFWMFLGFSFQAIGLEYTTAQKSGFLLYLNVKFVPILAFVLLGRSISIPTWVSAFAAFTGTALLATSGVANGADPTFVAASSINIGDAWSIAAALASAMFILRLEKASEQVKDAAQLNAACLWVVTLFAALWTIAQSGGNGDLMTRLQGTWDQIVTIASNHTLELMYLSGVTTALANWIQTKAQREVSAERASVIYAMDPVYGAVFSSVLLGENLNGFQGWLGAGIIAAAAATNAFIDLPRLSDESKSKE